MGDLGIDSSHPYSREFSQPGVVGRYLRKFSRRIDRIRHTIEVSILRQYVYGDCFDCSIGTGRFINQLPRVKNYSGMDYSKEFVNYILEAFPGVEVTHGDLMKGIEAPDQNYDTTLCIRTLFALENVDKVIREMSRITKKGGLIIFDYGVRPGYTKLADGTSIRKSHYNIEEIIQQNSLKVVAVHNLDSWFARAVKTRWLWSVGFHSRFNIAADCFYIFVEKALSKSSADRKLRILEK